MTKLRVLHLVNSFRIGGAEKFLADLLFRGDWREVENEICVLFDEQPSIQEFDQAECQVHALKLYYKYDLTQVKALVRLVNQGSYDILHVHLFPAQLFGALASYLTSRCIYVTTEHGSVNRRRQFAAFKFLDAFVYSRYTAVVCVSNAVKGALIRWLPGLQHKIWVVPNGVVTEKFCFYADSREKIRQDLGLRQEELVFTIVARLHPPKNHHVLIKAFREVTFARPKTKLLVLGDGPLPIRRELEQLRDDLGLATSVTFLGARGDVPKILAASDIFVLPSKYEGLPVSVVEAMAAGLPVIGTTGPGFTDVIVDGETGLLVPPDDPNSLSKTMIRLALRPEERRRLGEAGKARAREHFDIKVSTRHYEELYFSLM